MWADGYKPVGGPAYNYSVFECDRCGLKWAAPKFIKRKAHRCGKRWRYLNPIAIKKGRRKR